MPLAKITSKGQVTIPIAVRKSLNLNPGDQVSFELLEGGKAEMERKEISIEDAFGILHRPGMKAHTVEEMNESIAEYVREKHGRR